MQIHFDVNHSKETVHTCESHRSGSWIVFTCTHCEGYERKINFETGEMVSQPNEDPFVLHQGQFVPIGLENVETSAN